MNTVKFLQEHPAKKDEFEGAHEQIAESLADLVSSEKTAPCMIALEGGLGSGKSTVLKILEEDKTKSSNFEVFVFDCFKYQNGPIRRAFIERFYLFIEDCISTFYGCKDKKLDELEALKLRATGRLDETKGSDEFHLSRWTLLFTSFLPLSGAALIVLGNNYSHLHILIIILLILVAIAPVAQVLLGWLGKWRSCKKLSMVLPDISFKTGERTSKTMILSTTEVTSVDLAKYYEEFLKLLPSEKKIVVVLDNIDRLDVENLFDVWADMEIFSGEYGGKPHWVIVPYAPEQLQRAFEERYKNSDEKKLPEEFINKWFTLRYRVPDVLLSDWRKYFIRNWGDTFADADKEECSQALLLFRRHRTDSQDISPRNIKHFINEVAVYQSSTVEENINRLVIVVYRLLIDYYQADLLALFRDRSSDIQLIYEVDNDWQKSMAVLHYNVSRERAQQIILYEPMEEAINNRSSENFIDRLSLDGGYDCLAELLEERRDFSFLENVFICLNSPDAPKDEEVLNLLKLELARPAIKAFQKPRKFVKSLESVLGVELAQDYRKKFYDKFKIELKSTKDEDFEQALASVNSLIPCVGKENVIEITPERLINFWLPNQETYENITISNYTQSKEYAESCFEELTKQWKNLKNKNDVPWSSSDVLELGLLFPKGDKFTSLALFVDIENIDNWFGKELSEDTTVQALYLLVILYDENTDYSPLFQKLLPGEATENFSKDKKSETLAGLLALAIKTGQFSEYREGFTDFEIDEHFDTIDKLLHTSCGHVGVARVINRIEKGNVEEWKEIIKSGESVCKFSIGLYETGSVFSTRLVRAIASLWSDRLDEKDKSDDASFMFECTNLLRPYCKRLLAEKIRCLILDNPTATRTKILNKLIANCDDWEPLIIPDQKSNAKGFIKIFKSIVKRPHLYGNLARHVAKNAHQVAERVRAVHYIRIGEVRDILKEAPVYKNASVISSMEEIFEAFGVELN